MKSSNIKVLTIISFLSLSQIGLSQYVGLTVEGPSTNIAEDSTALLIKSQRIAQGEGENILVNDTLYIDGNSIDGSSALNIHSRADSDVSLVHGGGRVFVARNSDVSLNQYSGSFVIGDSENLNLGFDDNEIMARDGNSSSTLYFQADGGDLSVGDRDGSHFEINGQEIMARQGDNTIATATLFIQPIGGDVKIGSALLDPTDVYIHSLAGTGTADVQADASGKLMRSASDIRLKKDINPISGALDRIVRLQGVSYRWKDRSDQDLTYGLIAQDVKRVLPEIVTSDGNYYGINYSELPALIIEAIKEQQHIIVLQQKEIQLLKERLNNIEVDLRK